MSAFDNFVGTREVSETQHAQQKLCDESQAWPCGQVVALGPRD